METHTHHLHKASSHGWKHYFFEFFMLFLAVFCGFLAEYQLEHIIERDRETQYMRSMTEDLESDESMLENNVVLRTQRIAMIDSLVYSSTYPNGAIMETIFISWLAEFHRLLIFSRMMGRYNN